MNEERLRRALEARNGSAAVVDACPDPGVLWDLNAGALEAEAARAVGAHAARCGACREALRIAREAGAVASAAPRVPLGGWARWAAAVAAVLVLGFLVTRFHEPDAPPAPSPFREGEAAGIEAENPRAVVSVGEPVVLRWTEVPGARYDLTLAGEDLQVLAVTRGLERTDYQVPAEVLATIPPGRSLLWQVEAVLPNGRRIRSATFSVRLR